MGITPQSATAASSRVGVVLEVTLDRQEVPEWVGLVVSIPGREGTSRKVWALKKGQFDPAQWDDFEAFAYGAITAWMLATIGVQGVLPMSG